MASFGLSPLAAADKVAREYINNVVGPELNNELLSPTNHSYQDKFALVQFLTQMFIGGLFDLLIALGASKEQLCTAAASGQRIHLGGKLDVSTSFVEEKRVKTAGVSSSTKIGGDFTISSSSKGEASVFMWKQQYSVHLWVEAGRSARTPIIELEGGSHAWTLTKTAPLSSASVAFEPVDITAAARYAPFTSQAFKLRTDSPYFKTPINNPEVKSLMATAVALSVWRPAALLCEYVNSLQAQACDASAPVTAQGAPRMPHLPPDATVQSMAESVFLGMFSRVISPDDRIGGGAVDATSEGSDEAPSGAVSAPRQRLEDSFGRGAVANAETLWQPSLWSRARVKAIDEAVATVTATVPAGAPSGIQWAPLLKTALLSKIVKQLGRVFVREVEVVEACMLRGLVEAVGDALDVDTVLKYIEFHNSRRWVGEVAPQPMSFAVRAGSTSPEGIVEISRGGASSSVPLFAFGRCGTITPPAAEAVEADVAGASEVDGTTVRGRGSGGRGVGREGGPHGGGAPVQVGDEGVVPTTDTTGAPDGAAAGAAGSGGGVGRVDGATGGGAVIPSPAVEVVIGATTKVPLTGSVYVHTLVDVDFQVPDSATEKAKAFEMHIRSKPLCGVVVVVGTYAEGQVIPTAAMVVKGGDALSIPLNLKTIPSAKEFKAAVKQLSPEAAAFASAVRAHQLSSSLFCFVSIPLRPLVERAMRIPAGALAKEVMLATQTFTLLSKDAVPPGVLAPVSAAEVGSLVAQYAPEDVRKTDMLTSVMTVGDAVVELQRRVKRVQRVLKAQGEEDLLSKQSLAAANGGMSDARWKKKRGALQAKYAAEVKVWVPKLDVESDEEVSSASGLTSESESSDGTQDDDEMDDGPLSADRSLSRLKMKKKSGGLMRCRAEPQVEYAKMSRSAAPMVAMSMPMAAACAPMSEALMDEMDMAEEIGGAIQCSAFAGDADASFADSGNESLPPPPPFDSDSDNTVFEKGDAANDAPTPPEEDKTHTTAATPQGTQEVRGKDGLMDGAAAEGGEAGGDGSEDVPDSRKLLTELPAKPLGVDVDGLPEALDAAYEAVDSDGLVRSGIVSVAKEGWKSTVKRSLRGKSDVKYMGEDEVSDNTRTTKQLLDILTNAGSTAAAYASVHVFTVGVVSFPKALLAHVIEENETVVDKIDRVSRAVVRTLTHADPALSQSSWKPPFA